MTLDEAALVWGNGVLGGHVWSVVNDGCCDFNDTQQQQDAWTTIAELADGDDDCAAIDLACVMYAQDVAEGRHR